MVTDNVLRQTAALLSQVFKFETPTDVLLSKFFRENRKIGMHDRGIVAETVYTILRNYNKLTKVVNPQNTFTLVAYTWIKLMGVGRHEIRELKSISLGEMDKFAEIDLTIIELPAWLITNLSQTQSEEEIRLLSAAMAKQAPLTLRVNTIRSNRNDALKQLEEMEIRAKATKLSPYGIKLSHKSALMKNSLFLSGALEVQDEASQLAGMLLNPKRSEMVADFCAGAGGKTLLFGMLMHNTGRIYALDINDKRLSNLAPRLARSGLSNIYTQLINNENDAKVKRLQGKMDRDFVDAPCLGLGTIRRNPDLKFRQSEESLAEINRQQLSILLAASKLVKPGGRLVYATCSILVSENQGIIQQFIAENTEFEILEVAPLLNIPDLILSDPQYLELKPHIHDTDGFFACAMQKKITEAQIADEL